MRFHTLPEWLRWQESMHPNAIDLGLERVRQVLAAMHLEQPAYRVLTVGGTNGKGSCVAFLDAMLRSQGYAVGAYTSPHLLRYNERVCVQGREVTDAELVEAFARVDAARGAVSLTYFEFGTLAAFEIFRQRGIQVAVLEVGMGGRLDAVNVLEPEGALVASVALDHQEWLGDDRNSIGFEKAGIYRSGRPAICGDRDSPARLLDSARRLGADLQVLGRDYDWQEAGNCWDWHGPRSRLQQLPYPAMPGMVQLDNAASCVALLQAVSASLPVEAAAIRAGLNSARIPARFEYWRGDVSWVLDVAHNPAAAAVLAANLKASPAHGRTLAVVGMLRDKAVEEVVTLLAPHVDSWYAAGLEGVRGQTAAELARRMQDALPAARLTACGDVNAACRAARSAARSGDRILVFGSFLTVGAVLRRRQEPGGNYL